MATVDTSFLNAFYPEESLEILNVIQEKDKILIRMKSVTSYCTWKERSVGDNRSRVQLYV